MDDCFLMVASENHIKKHIISLYFKILLEQTFIVSQLYKRKLVISPYILKIKREHITICVLNISFEYGTGVILISFRFLFQDKTTLIE